VKLLASVSRFLPWLKEQEAKKEPGGKKEDSEAEENIGLKRDRQAKDSEVEEGPRAEVEPAASSSAKAADDGNTRSLAVDQGSIVPGTYEEPEKEALIDTSRIPVGGGDDEAALDSAREGSGMDISDSQLIGGAHEAVAEDDHEDIAGTHEEFGERSPNDHPVDGTYEEPVESSHGNPFPMGTQEAAAEIDHGHKSSNSAYEESSNGNRNNECLADNTSEELVDEHKEVLEGTRETTVGNKIEAVDGGGTPIQSATISIGELDPGKHDDPLRHYGQEATVAGAPLGSSSHQEEPENPSDLQSNRPRRSRKNKWNLVAEFHCPRPNL
jgi:hypothetical protein